MKGMSVFAFAALALAASDAWARSSEATTLRNDCKELVKLIDKNGEKNFLAWQTSSKMAALRAGRCLGVVEEFLRRKPSCGFREMPVEKVYGVIERLAETSGDAVTVEQQLKAAHCGR